MEIKCAIFKCSPTPIPIPNPFPSSSSHFSFGFLDSISSDISRVLTARLMCNAQLELPQQQQQPQRELVDNSISAVAGSRLSWLCQNGVSLSLVSWQAPSSVLVPWIDLPPPHTLPKTPFTPSLYSSLFLYHSLPLSLSFPSPPSTLFIAFNKSNRHSDLDSFSTPVEPQMSTTTSATWDSQSVHLIPRSPRHPPTTASFIWNALCNHYIFLPINVKYPNEYFKVFA